MQAAFQANNNNISTSIQVVMLQNETYIYFLASINYISTGKCKISVILILVCEVLIRIEFHRPQTTAEIFLHDSAEIFLMLS